MIEIQEIFRWYRDLPKMPNNYTTIQQEEWENEHLSILEKSFVGEIISKCPAQIRDISHNLITASADYNLDYLISYHDGKRYHYEKNTRRYGYAQISYDISYEELKFFDQLKSFNAREMVVFDGVIKYISWSKENHLGDSLYNSQYNLYIQLTLVSINKIKPQFLHAELLDENLKYSTNLVAKYKENCFVATACYGDYNAPEVLSLRKLRDEKLLKTIFGQMLVKIYYLVSPFIASLISESELLKKVVRKYLLEPIIKQLQQQNKP